MTLIPCNNVGVIDQRFRNAEDIHLALLEHHRLVLQQKAEQVFERNGSKGFLLNFDTLQPYAIVKTAMPCDAETLFTYLVDEITESLTDWNKTTVFAKTIQRISASEKILLVHSKVPVLDTREDLFYQYRHHTNDGAFIEVSTGVQHPMVPVSCNGVVRCELQFCSKEIRPLTRDTCAYTVVWQHNPGGWLSKLFTLKTIAGLLLRNMEHECKMIKEVLTDLEPAYK